MKFIWLWRKIFIPSPPIFLARRYTYVCVTVRCDCGDIKELNNIFTMKKLFYTAPEVEVIEIAVESGFALSGIGDGSDYGDGGEGSEMD